MVPISPEKTEGYHCPHPQNDQDYLSELVSKLSICIATFDQNLASAGAYSPCHQRARNNPRWYHHRTERNEDGQRISHEAYYTEYRLSLNDIGQKLFRLCNLLKVYTLGNREHIFLLETFHE